MSKPAVTRAGWMLIGSVVLLGVLHQDLWFWSNRRLVFGVLPIGLLYHAVFSLVCAVLWATAVRVCWPTSLEKWAESGTTETVDGVSGGAAS